ncbi:hypothetical protein [Paracoccus sp. JM45]|uniref:hypothetical protein n=1 Tax=Paracoccus sp. JM45 TaxID=2283626 RepID=UPI000E6CC344|nr:hypothetical protein [Paracoccus sp. JM45]RJE78552.1 hypothetical protein DWB67_17070 [Paracoccus sp. JM45]
MDTLLSDLLPRARAVTGTGDERQIRAVKDDIFRVLYGEKIKIPEKIRLLLRLHHARLGFQLSGNMEAPFTSLQEAQVQGREIEKIDHGLPFKRLFNKAALEKFPNNKGFRLTNIVYKQIESDFFDDFLIDPETDDIVVRRRPGARITIIAFSCIRHRCSGLGWSDFDASIAQNLNANLIILKDFEKRLFLKGVKSLGDFDATISGLRAILAEFSGTQIVALGASGGVYASLNIAPHLGINRVVSLAGPASLTIGNDVDDRQIYAQIDADIQAGHYKAVDIVDHIKSSSVSRVDYFVGGQNAFDMLQLNYLSGAGPKIHPHVYEKTGMHTIIFYALSDGSLSKALLNQI